MRLLILILISLLSAGCMRTDGGAPGVEGWLQPRAKSGFYRVKRGDTLYSIAWAFGLDYRALASANRLKPPYRIQPGQTLRMTIVPHKQKTRSIRVAHNKNEMTKRASPQPQHIVYVSQWRSHQPTRVVSRWQWPARGRVVGYYSTKLAGNKGINIKGRYGEPIYAAANGIVVYSGAGVRGYGNLIIIKHNDSYLSAYAFNKRILVKEGSRVRVGQKIAEMGRDNAGSTMLHFEIRRNCKPVNPLRYLS